MAITKKDVKELIDKYTDRITYIDSKENPEEYSRFETEVLNDVISDLENLLNKGQIKNYESKRIFKTIYR